MNCYLKWYKRFLHLLINHVIPGPDLYCAKPLALKGFSQHLPAKYTVGRDQKILPSEREALALCHLVNPALVVALRLRG